MKNQYSAIRTPTHTGVTGWQAILPDGPSYSRLEENLTADFVVVGGGFAGLAATRRLRQLNPEARIVLLEATRIGEGGAGRNSGFMIDLPHDLSSDDYAGQSTNRDKEIIRLNRQGIAFSRSAVEEYGIDRNYFDPIGKINGAASKSGEAHNESYKQHLTDLGEEFTHLDAKGMYELTGSHFYRSGLYTPGTVLIQPAGFVMGIAAGLSKHVKIFEHSPVVGFDKTGEEWHVRTLNGRISTPKIILANNGHLESFGIAKGRLMHIFLYASMTPELDVTDLKRLGGHPRWGITPSDPMGTTLRKIDTGQGGNRIITRTCASFHPSMKTTQSQLNRAKMVMQKKFEERFPQFAGMKMEYAWAGHLCLTKEAVSVTGMIDEGVYSGCVQNGLGATRGTLTGIAAAELASGVESDITKAFTKEKRPSKLPPAFIASIGANIYLRFKEFMAGKE